MNFTVMYPDMVIHRTGCKDIKRDRARNDSAYETEADSAKEVVDSELEGELSGIGYNESHFTIKPCCGSMR